MGFFTPDASFYTTYTDRGKYLLMWRVSLLFVVLFLILSSLYAFIDQIAFTFYTIVLFITSAGFIYLNLTKKFIPIFWTYAISASLLIFLSLQMVVPIVHYAEFFWIVSISIFSFIGLDRRVGTFFLVLNSMSISMHVLFRLNPNTSADRELSTAELYGLLLEILFAIFTIGYLLYQYMVFQSYAELQLRLANKELAEQNQIIVKKNEENSILAKEIHHRVKNNLQIIISLLRMHSEEVKSEETKHHFAEAMNRIMTMSLIHQKLYQEKELSNIDFDGYLKDLTQEIVSSSGNEHRSINWDIHSGVRKVGLKTIVPLGLLLNELMTNSLKHAFNGKDGLIIIHVEQTDNGHITLDYSDNGSWEADTPTVGGFGLELIGLLTSQLEGSFVRIGSRYLFELRNLDH
jgi:two-component sensor histidine kinase